MLREVAYSKTVIGKKAFELFIQNNSDEALINYASELGISLTYLKLNYIIPYTKREINPKPTKEELMIYRNNRKQHYHQIKTQNEMINFVSRLLSLKYANQVVGFINSSDYNISRVFKMLDEYSNNSLNKTKKLILARIYQVIEEHQDFLKTKKPKIKTKSPIIHDLELKNLTIQIIEKYLISNNIPFDDIMSEYTNQMMLHQFSDYLSDLANGNADEQYLIKKLTKKLDDEIINIEKIIIQIAHKIRKGLIGSFGSTQFSILDYYRMTLMRLDSLLIQTKKLFLNGKLSEEDYCLIEAFVKEHEEGNKPLSEKELIGYNGIKDDDNTKKRIISYLKNISVPMNLNSYKAAYQEYIQNKAVLIMPSPIE